jgi:outer membrane receptor for monomeric catechols
VLEKSPGVTVDKDGNISLKGKQGVQIYIDGKPSYVSGADLVNLLKNMNAVQLEQIEIMTNPPAKYDAAGNSGIINIKTKKNKAKGFNGSATASFSQGAYWRSNANLQPEL